MSKIRLHGSSSGYTEIAPVAASGNNTLTLPNDGTIISKDSNGAVGVTSVVTTTATITTAKVGAAVTISESGIEASGIGITCANINGTQIGGRRNLIINGAMEVAQRGTSSTGTTYGLDRMKQEHSGTDEAPTYAQVDISSGTSPYTEGFRKALKVTNGNQTSGAGSSDYVYWWTILEAQDVAKSGWNYTSASSFITISFWIKSSVAQNFYGMLQTADGTAQNYVYETGSLTADTWTKIIKTIPGNSNLQFNNDNGPGFYWAPARAFDGTDRTASMSLETWAAYSGSSRTPDATSTWYTTNDATLEITGLQMEVGPQATAFEHRSMGEELLLCQRYYFKLGKLDYISQHMSANEVYGIGMSDNDGTNIYAMVNFPVRMRDAPTGIDQSGSAADYRVRRDTTKACSGVPTFVEASEHYCRVNFPSASHGWGTGQMLWCMSAGSSGYLGFGAEI